MRNLSKSKIIAYRQCPKRLWLEIYKPELRDDSRSEMVFEIGYQVGEVARKIYDPKHRGVLIDIGELGHGEALAQSAALLRDGKVAVFEGGMTAGGALAYADVMLPDISDGTLRWKMIEVKSSTSVKDYHRDDIAVQSYIAEASGVSLSSVTLAHVDSTFVYQGDGDYQGLLKENDLTAEALSRSDEVKEWINGAQAVAALVDEPSVATGPHCTHPFTCGFCDYCNRDSIRPDFPISSLPRLHPNRRTLIEDAGHEDLRDVPDELLGAIQTRVKQCSITGETYFDAEGAAADLAIHSLPAHFLDFETSMFAVPIWKGTRPFQQIPFQFSLHILDESGDLQHHGFLDLTGGDPSLACAKSLIGLCGDHGPVFAYNAGFECRVMRELATRFPELTASLEAIVARVVDLLPIARNRYYHPSQHGSWSIKAVLPAVLHELSNDSVHALSYENLTGVQDGGMAVSAYMEAIDPAVTAERKNQIETQLIEYCKLDTFAMVRLWEVFSGRRAC